MNFLKGLVGPPLKVALTLDGLEGRAYHNPVQKRRSQLPAAGELTGSSSSEGGAAAAGAGAGAAAPAGPPAGHLPIFYDNEEVSGSVTLQLEGTGKKVEHMGVKVGLYGVIKTPVGQPTEFLKSERELEAAGTLMESKSYKFSFDGVERKYESYRGVGITLSYVVRVTMLRSLSSNVVEETEIWVNNYQAPPETNANIRMEVGIEESLHIEFEYNKSKYHLKDVIIGKIFFLLVRLKIKSMNISLIRRETTGSGMDIYHENRTLSKYEIMDGCPVKGEAIPVRLFLKGFDLTPSYKDVARLFSVSYILNLVLVDEDERRYFKQREIVLWRRTPQASKGGDEFAITSVEGRTELPEEYKRRMMAEKQQRRARRERRRAEKAARKQQQAAPSAAAAEGEGEGEGEAAAGGGGGDDGEEN